MTEQVRGDPRIAPNVEQLEDLEMAWAEQAFFFAEDYSNQLKTETDLSKITFTSIDDEIYQEFRKDFPKMNVAHISESEFKSNPEKWRKFLEAFKVKLPDYNIGTLVRLNVNEDFGPENTTFGVRLQFWAIEIARIKEGLMKKIGGDVTKTPRESENEKRINHLLKAQFDRQEQESGCAVCHKEEGAEGKPLSRCSRCKKVVYCSRECQTKDWPTHKANCKA